MAKNFDLFVDPGEKGIAQIGSKQGNIVFTGAVSREYCLLSNKRLYYKGVSYGTGNLGGKAKSEIVINLTSITSTGFCVIKHIGLLLIGLLFLIAGVAGAFALKAEAEVAEVLVIAGVVVFAIFLLLFFLIRKRLMQIVYSGGSLMLQCWGQPEKICVLSAMPSMLRQIGRELWHRKWKFTSLCW